MKNAKICGLAWLQCRWDRKVHPPADQDTTFPLRFKLLSVGKLLKGSQSLPSFSALPSLSVTKQQILESQYTKYLGCVQFHICTVGHRAGQDHLRHQQKLDPHQFNNLKPHLGTS